MSVFSDRLDDAEGPPVDRNGTRDSNGDTTPEGADSGPGAGPAKGPASPDPDGQLDPLTGLPNRRLLAHDLDAAIRDFQRSRMPFTVLYLDLDGFKPVNDTFGHAMGDRVLQQIARRLRQGGREADTFARFGGDEFVGLLRSTDSIEGATVIARRLRTSLEEPLVVGDHILRVGASRTARCGPSRP